MLESTHNRSSVKRKVYMPHNSSGRSLKRKVYTPLESRHTSSSSKRKVDCASVLHLHGVDKKSRQYMWYDLDLRHCEARAICKMPHDFPCNSASIAYVNHLYVFGGDYGSSRSTEGSLPGPLKSVFCFDLENPKKGWKKAPSMLFARFRPSAVALNGKIYVFGGSLNHFGEVFDISQNSWAELQPPFDEWGMSKHVLVDSSHSQILVYFPVRKSIYAYNVTTESWECLYDNYDDWSLTWFSSSVIVDRVIYRMVLDEDFYNTSSVKKRFLRAYDLDEKRELSIKYRLFGDDAREVIDASLFHLGNNRICLVGYNSELMRVKYKTFSVYRSKNSKEICVTIDQDSKLPQSIPLKVLTWEFVRPNGSFGYSSKNIFQFT